jgi:hypothetical protein
VSLERARAVADAARQRRTGLLRALGTGELAVAGLDADERAGDVKAVVIAESVPGVGKVRARRVLDAAGVPPSTRWADLSREQRRVLVEALTADGARPTAEQ